MKWEVTKVKHPNKGHTPNKGQKPMYQGVRYSESPLYTLISICSIPTLVILIVVLFKTDLLSSGILGTSAVNFGMHC